MKKHIRPSAGPTRTTNIIDIKAEAMALGPLLETSNHSLPELLVAVGTIAVMQDITGAANAMDMSAKLEYWIDVIPHRRRKKLRIHAALQNLCEKITRHVPASRNEYSAARKAAAKVMQLFSVIAKPTRDGTPRSRLANYLSMSRKWIRDFHRGESFKVTGNRLGVSGVSIKEAENRMTQKLGSSIIRKHKK